MGTLTVFGRHPHFRTPMPELNRSSDGRNPMLGRGPRVISTAGRDLETLDFSHSLEVTERLPRFCLLVRGLFAKLV